MKNIISIIKKEMDKIFKYPRMIFSTLVLPGLLIFILYAFMGNSLTGEITRSEEHKSIIYVINAPAIFDEYVDTLLLDENGYNSIIVKRNMTEKNDIVQAIKNGEVDALIEFEIDFDIKLANKEFTRAEINYDSVAMFSSVAYNKSVSIISSLKEYILTKNGIVINIIGFTETDLASETQKSGSILAMILPMLIITFIFAGALAVGPDAIAGEKERGTLATLLMAPIKKNEIILGKIFSATIITILSALSSFIGIAASLPFAKDMFSVGDVGINYGLGMYAQILIVIIVVAAFSSTVTLVASTLAKTIKEASAYCMPVYILAMFTGVISMFMQSVPKEIVYYIIPLYNCSLALKGILTLTLTLPQFFIVVASSLVYICLIVLLLLNLFKKERLMFGK